VLRQLCVDQEPVELDWSVVVVVVVDFAAKTAGATALAAKTAMAVSMSRIRLLRCIFSRLQELRFLRRLIRDFREMSLIVNGLLATRRRIVAHCEETLLDMPRAELSLETKTRLAERITKRGTSLKPSLA